MELCLASFDEVNKVGDGGSLMSGLINAQDLANISGAAAGLGDLNSIMDELNTSINDMSQGMIFSPEWWEEKKKFFGGYWDYLVNSFKDGSFKDDFINAVEEIGGWFEENLPNWSAFWEEVGYKIYDVTEMIRNAIDKIKEFAEDWNSTFQGVGEKVYDLSHNEDGSSKGWGGFWGGVGGMIYDSTHAAGGFPNKGSLFLAGEAGAELIGNFGTSQTKVINQSQITNNTQQPVMFQPTILIDGRRITATVVDNINTMTRSSGNSPLIQLG